MKLPLDLIRIDGATQPRQFLDQDVAGDYAEEMKAGAKFPPVEVFYDGTDYFLADGFHRYRATWINDGEEIECNVHQGTLEDAQWFSIAANKSHGLRRSNEDKQRAVKAALQHPKSVGLSDREIARHVGVDHQTVANWRGKLSGEIRQIETRTVTRNGTTYTQNTANIGRKEEIPRVFLHEQRSLSESTPPAASPQISRGFATATAAEEPSEDLLALASLIAAAETIRDCELTARDLGKLVNQHGGEYAPRLLETIYEFIGEVISSASSASA